MKKITFDELNLSKEMIKAISDLGYEEATPIQSQAIPEMLKTNDIIGQAQTGTGKTAAFGIPAIEMLDPNSKDIQVLILCPTRELAIQVSEELSKLSKYKKDVYLIPVYGGQPIERQIKSLNKGVQIVIGTPGRIIDHLDRGTLNLGSVKQVVLDEADEMLDLGFREDLEIILKNIRHEKQTVMFSATMSKPILELTKKYLKNPVNIRVVHEILTVPNTEQIYYEVKPKNKIEALTRTIDLYNFKLSLVFCNTKKGVDELVEQLQGRGYLAEGLHGDMRQMSREKVLSKFRKGFVEILVATDVAARGLDIENIEAVFNYDMPQDEEYYVHRVGRTGRAGKTGKAFTFVSGRDLYKLKDIQRFIKTKLSLNRIPSYDDVEEMRINIFIDEIRKTINSGELKKYMRIVERLVDEEFTSLDVAAALIKMNLINEKENDKSDFNDDGNFAGRKQVRLFLSLGKKDKIKPGDIVGAIAGESGLPGKVVGEIDMYDKFTFVNVIEEFAEQIIQSMNGNQIRGNKVKIEIAEKKESIKKPKRK